MWHVAHAELLTGTVLRLSASSRRASAFSARIICKITQYNERLVSGLRLTKEDSTLVVHLKPNLIYHIWKSVMCSTWSYITSMTLYQLSDFFLLLHTHNNSANFQNCVRLFHYIYLIIFRHISHAFMLCCTADTLLDNNTVQNINNINNNITSLNTMKICSLAPGLIIRWGSAIQTERLHLSCEMNYFWFAQLGHRSLIIQQQLTA